MKRLFIQGVLAGTLASIASIVLQFIYQKALGVDFGKIINAGSIIGSSIFGTLLICLGQFLLSKWNKRKWSGWFNILVVLLSFLTIIGPIGITLPLDVKYPELFPGLVVPMHFFPALCVFMLNDFFSKEDVKKKTLIK